MRKTDNSLLNKCNQKGIALVLALVITMIVMIMIVSTMYVINRSTSMSGAGKRYQTASAASDGAVEVMKDSIGLLINGEPESVLPFTIATPGSLVNSILNVGSPVTVTLTLPGTDLSTNYPTSITIERVFTKSIPGSRIQFPPSSGGAGGEGVYYRINTVVTGPNNARAETTALYRYVD